MLVLVAAMNHHRTIGLNGAMPWHNPEDLRHFRKTTLNQTLLMGRKTFAGLPKKLDQRNIYVVTRSEDVVNPVHDLEAFLKQHQHSEDIVYVCGGGEIYRQSLPYASKIILSIIDNDVIGDTFFPEFGSEFKEIVSEEKETFVLKIFAREEA